MITYNPKNVYLSLAGQSISGFADNTFININPTNDSIYKVKDIGGGTAFSKNLDFDCTLEITLLQNSEADATLRLLQQSRNESASNNLVRFPFLLSDRNTGLEWSSDGVLFTRTSDVSFGAGQSARLWAFYCENVKCTQNPDIISARGIDGLIKNTQNLVNNFVNFFG